MKKYLMILIVLSFLVSSVSVAETAIDLTTMDLSELSALYGNVLSEICRRNITVSDTTPSCSSPILFRKIPWETSATDFLSAMNEQGLSGSVREAYSCESWEFKPDDGKIVCVDKLSDCGYKYSCSPQKLKVGGFAVDSIEACFLYGFDDDGVYASQEKSSLYRASYSFEVIEGRAAYEVLRTKMGLLYGEGQVGTDSAGWWSTGGDYHTYCDWTVWYGEDNTGAVLYHVYETYDADNTVKSDNVYLLYGRTYSLSMLSDYKAAKAREELEEAMQSDDTDGL